MTFYVENETDTNFSFDVQQLVRQVMETVLEEEGCPYEASVNVLLTDNEGIRGYNREYRGIDRRGGHCGDNGGLYGWQGCRELCL